MIRKGLTIGASALLATLMGCSGGVEEGDDGAWPPEGPKPTLRFEMTSQTGDFYRMPWPHDVRRSADGNVALRDFPNPRNNPFVARYVEVAEREVHGFSTMPVIYIPAERALSDEGLPTAEESLREDALVQLIDVSVRGCGRRVPIRVRADGPSDGYEAPHRFTVEMIPGGVLDPATTYALILRAGLKTAEGTLIEPNATSVGALRSDNRESPLSSSSWPLRRCLPDIANDPSLLLATVFTTQDPVEELQRLRDTVRDPDAVALKSLVSFAHDPSFSNTVRDSYIGTFEAPIFLRGTTPYSEKGGGLEFDALGAPIVQRWESVPFSLSFPKGSEGPHAVIVWVDGTGAGIGGEIGDAWHRRALEEGFAVASLVAPFHEGREVAGSDEVLSSFNYLNPEAGRTVFRQQAAEVSYYLRVLAEAVNPLLESSGRSLDMQNVHYGGHSQGGIVGALVTAVEPDFQSAVLNGTGGWLAVTILERKDVMDIAGVVRLLFKMRKDFDRSHPIIQLAQMTADVVDPQNYVRRWAGSPNDPDGIHVLLINGNEDPTTHVDSVNHLTLTAGLSVLEPAGWNPDTFGVFEVQFAQSPVAPHTRTTSGRDVLHAAWLESGGGHFTLYRNAMVRELALELWRSVRDGEASLTVP